MTKLPSLTRAECEAQLDRLLKIPVKRGDRLLVVGDNACGKSYFRRIAAINFKTIPMVVHASMALRTSNMSHMGAIAGMVRDTDWLATSHNTFSLIKNALSTATSAKADGKEVALCVDEPEIGMGAAAQRGMVEWLLGRMEAQADDRAFTMLVTHSPIFVRRFAAAGWKFTDLSFSPSATVKKWLARQASEVLTPDTLEQRAGLLFEVVRDFMNARRKAKE